MEFGDYDPYERLDAVASFTLTSSDMTQGLPLKAPQRSPGAGGQSVSPQLSWSGFPGETRSFAVTCFDPDAPTGSGFWHWAVFNVPVGVTELAPGAGADNAPAPGSGTSTGAATLPGAITLPNEYRNRAYEGAEPPEGTGRHRYFFVVHAVDTDELVLDPESTPAVLGFNLHFHTLGRAVLVATSEYGDE